MKINNIVSTDYRVISNSLELDLLCKADEALAMNSSIIEVRTDHGDLVESFVGYTKNSVTVDATSGKVTLKLLCGTEGAILESMKALQSRNQDLQIQMDEQASAIQELAAMAAGGVA